MCEYFGQVALQVPSIFNAAFAVFAAAVSPGGDIGPRFPPGEYQDANTEYVPQQPRPQKRAVFSQREQG